EPEDERVAAALGDRADDPERQVHREDRPAERDLLPHLPAELAHRLLADDAAVADLLEALERARVDLVVGPDGGDRARVEAEVRELVLRLVVDAAEPAEVVDGGDAGNRADLVNVGVGEPVREPGLVVDRDAYARADPGE